MHRLPAVRLASVLLASSAIGACGGGSGSDLTEAPSGPAPVASVRVTPATASIAVGSSVTLTASLRDTDGAELSGRPVTWLSDRENMAPVSSTGVVTASAPGIAIIRATSEGKTGTAVVTVTPVPPPSPGRAAAVTVIAGGAQTAEVTHELPEAVAVRVTDAQGLPVPNQLVNFVPASGGGSVFAGSAQTNAAGEARERWTLGPTAGEQALEARAVDPVSGAPIVFARITATGTPGAVTDLQVRNLCGPERSGACSDTLWVGDVLDLRDVVVYARDRHNNFIWAAPDVEAEFHGEFEDLVLGVTFWRGNEGGEPVELPGSSFPLTTPFEGLVYVWEHGQRLGTTRLTVAIRPNETVASVTVLPTQASIEVGGQILLQATAYDGSGNPVAGRTATWTTSDAGIATGTSGASGEAIITGVAPGTASITASIEGKSAVATILVLQPSGAPSLCQQIAGASVIAHDGVYLGRLLGKYDAESIYNEYGKYGGKYAALSIYNEYGKYGGEYAAMSPFNKYSTTPPSLVKDGHFLAYFTVNEFKTPGVNPNFAQTCEFF